MFTRLLLGLSILSAAVAQPKFSLRLTGSPEYHQGELIRAEVLPPGPGIVPGQPPPPEQWQFAGLLLDPAAGCGSKASPCLQQAGLPFDKTDPVHRFGMSSGPLLLSLNNYLPALRPGHYRTALLTRKLVLTNRSSMSTTYGYADPPQYAASNDVEFEITAASPAWISRVIADGVAKLKGPQPNSREAYESRRAAAEQLRFLDRPAAWRASLSVLPAEEFVLLRGLAASRQPAQVCELMQSAIPAPTQAVSTYYLTVVAQACTRAHFPPASPGTQQEYWKQRYDHEQDAIGTASASLAAALSVKQGEAKAIALQTLLERVQQVQANGKPQPLPEWIPTLKSEFAKSIGTVEVWRRSNLLSMFGSALRSPDMAPLFESVLDGWRPGDYYEAPRAALKNLYEIDPARAQARIRTELGKDRTWLETSQLELLPASAARIPDDALIEGLAAAQRAGGWNVDLRMSALAKYASPRALPRIKSIQESQQVQCQPELMAYFIRVDPAYADRVFHRQAWDMQAAPPPCAISYFERTPRLAMGPVLEKYMIAYLAHRDVPLKKAAAQALGRFGSPAARGPLLDAFRYFHDYWNGKESELTQNAEGVSLEVEQRNALSRAANWLATDADLRAIESLCISDRCRYETGQDLRAWQKPLRIELSGQSGGIRATVAQYYGIETVEALKQRLAQFPKGTEFVLAAVGGGVEGAAADIRKYAAARGLVIVAR